MATTGKTPIEQTSEVARAEALLKRVSEAISGVSAIVTLLIALSSDELSTNWLLWIATGVCSVCFFVVFAFQRPTKGTRSFKAFCIAFGGSALLLGAAWLFAFRDEIRFSKAVTSFSNKPSVLIDPRVSRSVLPSKATGAPPQRLASYVDELVQDGHRTRICLPNDCPDEHLLFVVSGVLMDNGFAFELSIPAASPPPSTNELNPTGFADVLGAIDTAQTFQRHGLEHGPAVIRVDGQSESAQVAIQAAYHLATAVRLLRGPDFRNADEHVKQFLALSRVLSQHTSPEWILQGTLVAARYYHLKGDINAALEVLRSGRETFPKDERLAMSEAYLRMESEGPTDVADLVAVSSTSDAYPPTSFPLLRGVFLARAGMFWEASGFLEQAALSSVRAEDTTERFRYHLAAALLSALASGAPAVRGTRIVDNAEQAIRLYPKARLPRLLEAFGNALKESTGRSEELFEALQGQALNESEIAACNYWRARAYAETSQLDKAEHILESMTVSHPADASTLGLYSEVLMNRGRADDGMSKARLALKQDAKEAKGNRLLGLDEAQEAARAGNSQRQAMAKAALEHLSASIRNGGENEESYIGLSDVYRTLGKASQARQASRRALEFACSPGGEELACRVRDIRNLLESKKMNEATLGTNSMLSLLEETRQQGDELQRSRVLVEAAVAWYENRGLDEAEILYRNVVKDLNAVEPSITSQAILSQVSCNVGFIFIDRGQNEQALAAFRQGLKVRSEPDCEAGMAVALRLTGRHSEALVEYKRARDADPTYEIDIDMLKRINQWSEVACRQLRTLAAEYKKTRNRGELAESGSPI